MKNRSWLFLVLSLYVFAFISLALARSFATRIRFIIWTSSLEPLRLKIYYADAS